MDLIATLALCIASVLGALRWLRVAQREHYLTGSATRFAVRWWFGLGFNRLLAAGAVINVLLIPFSRFFGLLAAVPIGAGPFGLKLRGKAPGPVNWTRRLKTLAAVTALISLVLLGVGWLIAVPAVMAGLIALFMPLIVDVALAVTAPIEKRNGLQFVEKATAKLAQVSPLVIGITGSYGKTSTKGYVAHLVDGTRSVVPTPASFNNSMGLARAINESLPLGTEVFVAEMGTYGPGEIREMVEWVKPTIAAITAIGPVHLERMGTEEVITEAKAEIFDKADVCVLNVDNDHLDRLAGRLAAAGGKKKIVRCSGTDRSCDVAAVNEGDALVVVVKGEEIARIDGVDAPPTNIAVAVALALEAGVPAGAIAKRLPTLPVPPNRLSVGTGSTGATIIDDTFNSNPAGARNALRLLQRHSAKASRIVLVTPGMVELGDRQFDENRQFAAEASEICTDVVIVGSTNRKALTAGAHEGRARLVFADDRERAVAWVKENVGPGDAVLYENDLPDHFP